MIIGVDEAGRGPWMGPVVASAVGFGPKIKKDHFLFNLVDDSKKMTEKKRKNAFQILIQLAEKGEIFFGVGVVDNFLIDEKNIRMANREAMRRALFEISLKVDLKKCKKICIDGRDNYVFEEVTSSVEYIVGGDGKVPEISAASILAKVFRDELVEVYAKLYPSFGLEKHKGYGTKQHGNMLSGKEKLTGIHRFSYIPVKKLLIKEKDEKNTEK